MRCETFLEALDRLDADGRLSRSMRAHVASCPSCAEASARMQAALEGLRDAGALRAPGQEVSLKVAFLDERIMAAVRLMPLPHHDYFASRDWVIAGLVMTISVGLIPFGQDFAKIIALFGMGFALPLALVLGTMLTAYGAFFVGTHVDEVQAFVSRRTRFR